MNLKELENYKLSNPIIKSNSDNITLYAIMFDCNDFLKNIGKLKEVFKKVEIKDNNYIYKLKLENIEYDENSKTPQIKFIFKGEIFTNYFYKVVKNGDKIKINSDPYDTIINFKIIGDGNIEFNEFHFNNLNSSSEVVVDFENGEIKNYSSDAITYILTTKNILDIKTKGNLQKLIIFYKKKVFSC